MTATNTKGANAARSSTYNTIRCGIKRIILTSAPMIGMAKNRYANSP